MAAVPANSFGKATAVQKDHAELQLQENMGSYLAGRIDAFDALYEALAGPLRAYLCSLCRDSTLASDLVQETFLQMHKSRRTYEPGRPVMPWAYAIARHVFLMHRRAARRADRVAAAFATGRESSDVVDLTGLVFDRWRLREALKHVTAAERTPVVMHHVQGWTFAEIATRLGIRVNAARTRASRGLKKMREALNK